MKKLIFMGVLGLFHLGSCNPSALLSDALR